MYADGTLLYSTSSSLLANSDGMGCTTMDRGWASQTDGTTSVCLLRNLDRSKSYSTERVCFELYPSSDINSQVGKGVYPRSRFRSTQQ